MNLVSSALQNLYPYVRAVVGSHKDSSAELVGSAFLFKRNNKLFLITAAHVWDHENDKYQIFIDRPNEGLVRINGEVIMSSSIEPKRKDDKLDFAIISLDNDISSKLSNTPTLTLDNFELNYNSIFKYSFIVIGFPVSKNKGNIIRKNLELTPYGFLAQEACQKKYSRLGIANSQHILLDYNCKKVFSESNEKRNAVGLQGLSGSPVWGITESGKCKIVSLFIEHHQKNIKVAVTTKLGEIIANIPL